MASRGLLWVGTSLGFTCSLPLPRLRDGVPLIKGRPDVSLHAHNGPVQFLIPIYCGTVNLWQRAQGLNSTESMVWRENATSRKERKGSKDSLEDEVKEVRTPKEMEETSAQANGLILDQAETPSERGSTDTGLNRRKSRSAENLFSASKKMDFRHSDNVQEKALTLSTELMQKLDKRNLATANANSQGDENEIKVYFRDLMSDEEVKREQSLKYDTAKTMYRRVKETKFEEIFSAGSSDSTDITKSIKQKQSSVRIHGDQRPSAVNETSQSRNCNAVVVVSGGDGYIDWRSTTQSHKIHSTEASLMLWIYKF